MRAERNLDQAEAAVLSPTVIAGTAQTGRVAQNSVHTSVYLRMCIVGQPRMLKIAAVAGWMLPAGDRAGACERWESPMSTRTTYWALVGVAMLHVWLLGASHSDPTVGMTLTFMLLGMAMAASRRFVD